MPKQLAPLRFVIVPSLPATGVAGDTVFLLSDKKLYTHDGTSFKSGGGVAGPPISTDGAIAAFSGTSGSTLASSSVLVTSAGGLQTTIGSPNPRDATATDLQTARSASQVASGVYATISGGYYNTAIGSYSTLSGGYYNIASARYSCIGGGSTNSANAESTTVGGGANNTVSGFYSFIGGGYYNNCSNTYSVVAGGSLNSCNSSYSVVTGGASNFASGASSSVGGGSSNNASGDYSCIPGGQWAATYRTGQFSYSSGKFSSSGDAQFELVVMRCKTINATSVELTTDGLNAGSSNILNCPISSNASAIACQISIVALGIAGTNKGKAAYFTATPLFVNRSVGGTSGIVNNPNIQTIQKEVNAWNISITGLMDRIAIAATGDANTTILWVANVYVVKTFS